MINFLKMEDERWKSEKVKDVCIHEIMEAKLIVTKGQGL